MFFLKILPLLNHIYFIDDNINKVILELIFLFLTICCQNQDISPNNIFREANIKLYIFLFIQHHILGSLAIAFKVNIKINRSVYQIKPY